MRRRIALQILATSTFSSVAVTASGSGLNSGLSSSKLLSALRDVHEEASACLRRTSEYELTSLYTDVAFFAQEAQSRIAARHVDTPAFWQNCHARFVATKTSLMSRQQSAKLVDGLERCLPLLQTTLERSLV